MTRRSFVLEEVNEDISGPNLRFYKGNWKSFWNLMSQSRRNCQLQTMLFCEKRDEITVTYFNFERDNQFCSRTIDQTTRRAAIPRSFNIFGFKARRI